MHTPSFRTSLVAALALAAGAAPAIAAAKEAKVTMPARALKDADARICMPRAMSRTVGKDKSQPATLCQTVADWATHGVTIVGK